MMKPEKAIELKVQTMEYRGTETGKMLALYNRITTEGINGIEGFPKFANAYAICLLLATMKKEILGRNLAPMTIIKILIRDYEESAGIINEARAYVEQRKGELFLEDTV